MSFLGLKVYRNVYLKKYSHFPTQMLTGRNDLVYTGKIVCGVGSAPPEYDPEKDLYINCDCQFKKFRKLTKVKF